jgi:hypothetical protein
LDVDKLVSQFVVLRDRKRELVQQHEEQLKPYNKLLDEIGNKLLEYMQSIGVDNLSAPSGSAHQITKRSATIRDGAAFRPSLPTGSYDLVDWKANAVAVFDYTKDNEVPAPGVNASPLSVSSKAAQREGIIMAVPATQPEP